MSSEHDSWENHSEGTFSSSESIYTTSQSAEKEMINDQLIVLEPNTPIMIKIQNTLKEQLLKQKEIIQQELLSLEEVVRAKKNDQSLTQNKKIKLEKRVETQDGLLSEFRRMIIELEKTNKLTETSIDNGKQRYNEILTKNSIETEKLADLKRKLNCLQGLLNDLKKDEKEQEITFNMYNNKKSQTQQYKKKLLSDQQKQDLLLSSLTREILRLEDRMKQLGELEEIKYNEIELLKQKVMDSSTDLDAINRNNIKITSLWNEELINIQQFDKSFQKKKMDLQEAQNEHQTLLMEAKSYKCSAQEEIHKKMMLNNALKKLKREQNSLQHNLTMCSNRISDLKDEFSKLIQMKEFQSQNLNQVIIDQKSMKNEINSLLYLLKKKTNKILSYEEDILDELKKKIFSNKGCVQINNKISDLKVQNKEHEFMLVGVENNLSQVLFKLEQYRETKSILEKDIEENIKRINNQEFALSSLDSEKKKLQIDIQNTSKKIDQENKHLENLKKKCNEGTIMTPQMQVDQVKQTTEKVRKEINILKQTWIQKQTKNIQLLNKRNEQLNKISNNRIYVSVLETKNAKLEKNIVSLSKEINGRTLTNMRNTILKLNENFNQNKGKSSQLLNENEWIQCSYIAELKKNEKQILEYVDGLKLLKNELHEIKNVYIEKQRESKSWDSKMQLLNEMKKEVKNKEGDAGQIDTLKKEIHRMQIKESQLKKLSEKIMSDVELCLAKRVKIYSNYASKATRSKQKNEAKKKIMRECNNLRFNIKKIEIENKKNDQSIRNSIQNKMELESKLTYLTDQLVLVKAKNDDLIKNIEDTETTKVQNIYNLCYKQNYAKFLDEVKKEKYRLLIKNESTMNEELTAEWKKNSDLISVVELLKIDFPYLDVQIIRLLSMLNARID